MYFPYFVDVLTYFINQDPINTSVIRLLGALVRDIYRQDAEALNLFNHANMIEEAVCFVGFFVVISFYLIQSYFSESVSLAVGDVKEKDKDKEKKKKKKKKTIHGHGYNMGLAEDGHNLVPLLIPSLIFCVLVLFGALISTFVLTFNDFNICSSTVAVFVLIIFFMWVCISFTDNEPY
jgi:hypothetical protein